jgi:hypothetical protein
MAFDFSSCAITDETPRISAISQSCLPDRDLLGTPVVRHTTNLEPIPIHLTRSTGGASQLVYKQQSQELFRTSFSLNKTHYNHQYTRSIEQIYQKTSRSAQQPTGHYHKFKTSAREHRKTSLPWACVRQHALRSPMFEDNMNGYLGHSNDSLFASADEMAGNYSPHNDNNGFIPTQYTPTQSSSYTSNDQQSPDAEDMEINYPMPDELEIWKQAEHPDSINKILNMTGDVCMEMFKGAAKMLSHANPETFDMPLEVL